MRTNLIADAMHDPDRFPPYLDMCSECPGRAACDTPVWPSREPSASAALDFIVQKSEDAIHDGLQLEQWCRRRAGSLSFFPIVLGQRYELPYRAEGFYDSAEINGCAVSVMGCRQEVELGTAPPGDASAMLRDFALREFMNRANWSKPDGTSGGFLIRKCFYKTTAGAYGRFAPEERPGCIDWRQLGGEYEWVLLTMYLNDFVMEFGPYRKRFKEALGFVAHRDFVHVAENPSDTDVLEVTIGYPVAGYAPIPNHFGFGPGKFGAAVKSFTFLLSRHNQVKVRLFFAAAPRCRKVFDFGQHVPDPVYGGAELLHHLSLGLWKTRRFHDMLDGGMLAQHCRVHESLMDGVGKVWNQWAAESAKPA